MGGRLFRGDDGRAGELGHTQVVADGELCRCGLRGCWETTASVRWLRAEAGRRGLPSAQRTTTAGLFAAGTDGATALLEDYATHVAAGMSTLVNLLGIRTVIVHGDVNGGGEAMRQLLEQALRQASLGYLREEVVVVLSELDADAALLGAAALVLSETFRLAV
jgi:predicted NBD/HSP70 family sugar kinase